MIIYSCDVCGAHKEARCGSRYSLERALPDGWLHRLGRTRDNVEIAIVVCSEECKHTYDQLEVQEVGLAWGQACADQAPFVPAYPLTDARSAKAPKPAKRRRR